MTETLTLPAGTLCHLNGLPFELLDNTQVVMTASNYKLRLSQSVPLASKPANALLEPTGVTSSLSD